jgi:methylated-DNA-protein-cysteine methyltransferase-like protein
MMKSSDTGLSPVTMAIEVALRSIPRGKVSTYGMIARCAGLPNGARQVVRVLHSRAVIADLPWYRVLAQDKNRSVARIALTGPGYDEQYARLRAEGVAVSALGTVDLAVFGFPSMNEA